ncbi:MAG: hypothetical protein V2A54_01765, partial [Bacteroidota bacterium]
GIPKDSNTLYFPKTINNGEKEIATGIDSLFVNVSASLILYEARELVLYNKYIGHDIFRLILEPPFRPPTIISIHKDGTQVWLTAKQLNRYPEFLELQVMRMVPKYSDLKTLEQTSFSGSFNSDSIIYPNRHADIKIYKERQLGLKHWRQFEKLIARFKFWEKNPSEKHKPYLDGTSWILEGHTKNKYWFIERHNPTEYFYDCGIYLIELSKLQLSGKYY